MGLDFDFTKIGFYNKCEVIEVFAHPKKGQNFLIFALVTFEYSNQENIEEFLTTGLQKLGSSRDIKWGIRRRVVGVEDAVDFYNSLLEGSSEIDADKKLNMGKFKLLPEQYVQPDDEFVKPKMNYLLKNNFHNGSYIVEFFDEDKTSNRFLIDNPILLNDFSQQVGKIIPIRIANLSDRIGNIIFQFPINSFKIKLGTFKREDPKRYAGIKMEILPVNSDFSIEHLEIRVFEENDNLVTRQKRILVHSQITEIEMDDCFGTTVEIIDKNTSLLLYRYKFTIMKIMNFNMQVMSSQKRIFEINGDIQKIDVAFSGNNTTYGKTKDKEFMSWIHERKYEQELDALKDSRSFVQYFGTHNDEVRALQDIRYLIDKYSENGVYLWDPYLDALDIKKTFYFCKNAHVPLRAITALGSTTESSKQTMKANIHAELEKDNKQFLFLNLEVRGRIGQYGYNFHDRFLIFPLEKPKVWSLGISVNALGTSHHILQEVKNAQHILNAFNRLWDDLDNEDCLVWKNN